MEINKIDCMSVFDYIPTIPDDSIDVVITSPPYYALRDYGVDGQVGMEKTFRDYIDKMCRIFDMIRPKMKDTATLWVNLGDKYATDNMRAEFPRKQLILLPERFAIHMTDVYKWLLRSSIVWHKSNPLPESVKDRPSKEDERLFMFAKSSHYYYNIDAVRRPYADSTIQRAKRNSLPSKKYSPEMIGKDRSHAIHTHKNHHLHKDGRNLGNVWNIPTAQSKSAHVAPFHEKLIEPIVLAACPHDGLVFDPFMGSGTTAVVAVKYGRNYIGCDVNPDYVAIAELRLNNTQLKLF